MIHRISCAIERIQLQFDKMNNPHKYKSDNNDDEVEFDWKNNTAEYKARKMDQGTKRIMHLDIALGKLELL